MSIQHKTLRDEIVYVIGRASAPLTGVEIYERAKLADEIKQVSKALCALKDDGKIVRVEGEGRARYSLAAGQRAPAPAGKAGRSRAVQADDAAQLTGLPALDLPPPNDIGHSLNGAAGKTRRAPPENGVNDIQLVPGLEDQPFWWIHQNGCLEIAAPGDLMSSIKFTRQQAQRMAAMVLGAHDALERV